jgi:hypothetical protein
MAVSPSPPQAASDSRNGSGAAHRRPLKEREQQQRQQQQQQNPPFKLKLHRRAHLHALAFAAALSLCALTLASRHLAVTSDPADPSAIVAGVVGFASLPSPPSAVGRKETEATAKAGGEAVSARGSLRKPVDVLSKEREGKSAASKQRKQAGRGGENKKGERTRTVATPDQARGKEKPRTVGVAVTVTGCDSFPPDGAAVLQYSVMRQQEKSRYKYSFYAIYHPNARKCTLPLADLNFTLLERESPVLPHEIKGSFLREKISKTGAYGSSQIGRDAA